MKQLLMTLALAPTTALAAPNLLIDNQFDGRVDVHIDGGIRGSVNKHETLGLRLERGLHEVVVKRNHVVVSQTMLRTPAGRTTELTVVPPPTTLRIHNDAAFPLLIAPETALAEWVQPGRSIDLVVTSGRREVQASALIHGKSYPLGSRQMFLEPGEITVQRMHPRTALSPAQVAMCAR